MSEHYIKKCSCGAIIEQCRCMSKDKKVIIVEDGCVDCQTLRLLKKVKNSKKYKEFIIGE